MATQRPLSRYTYNVKGCAYAAYLLANILLPLGLGSLTTFARTLITFARTLITFARTLITLARTLITFARTLITFARTLTSFAPTVRAKL